jgi:hypothetical protein
VTAECVITYVIHAEYAEDGALQLHQPVSIGCQPEARAHGVELHRTEANCLPAYG